jgi:hypothetical protein
MNPQIMPRTGALAADKLLQDKRALPSVFVADTYNHSIRMITHAGGEWVRT